MAITAVIGAQIGSFLANKAPSVTMNWGFGLYLIINGIVILKTGMKTITDKVSGFANSKFLKGGLDTLKEINGQILFQPPLVSLLGLLVGLLAQAEE